MHADPASEWCLLAMLLRARVVLTGPHGSGASRPLADDDLRYAELNREFHFTVYEYAGSPLLMSLMRLLWASLHGGPRVSRTHAESARQHDEILAALADADASAAAVRTCQHIRARIR